jgi:ABC-type transporter MlaC component
MMKHIVFSVLLLQFIVFIPAAQAQKEKKQSLWQQLNTPTLKDTTADDYYGSTSMRYEDYVYRSYIKSIQLHDVSFEL